jgi:hypothetical protein
LHNKITDKKLDGQLFIKTWVSTFFYRQPINILEANFRTLYIYFICYNYVWAFSLIYFLYMFFDVCTVFWLRPPLILWVLLGFNFRLLFIDWSSSEYTLTLDQIFALYVTMLEASTLSALINFWIQVFCFDFLSFFFTFVLVLQIRIIL